MFDRIYYETFSFESVNYPAAIDCLKIIIYDFSSCAYFILWGKLSIALKLDAFIAACIHLNEVHFFVSVFLGVINYFVHELFCYFLESRTNRKVMRAYFDGFLFFRWFILQGMRFLSHGHKHVYKQYCYSLFFSFHFKNFVNNIYYKNNRIEKWKYEEYVEWANSFGFGNRFNDVGENCMWFFTAVVWIL